MATLNAQLIPLQITNGVQTGADSTPLSATCYTMTDKVRFWRGRPQKIGGCRSLSLSQLIKGTARSMFGAIIANLPTTVIGTNSYLYALYGQTLTNITPVQTTTHAIANSLATDYITLANNPITTVNGSGIITIADTNAASYRVGDSYTLSGAATTNGILNTAINTSHIVRSTGANSVVVSTTGTASSSGSGGGASVVRSTGLITATAASHGQADGDRVRIAAAVAAGGVTAPQINSEFIIRNSLTNSFAIMTAGTATSSVSSAGGAATTYQKQLDAGNVNASYGVGYGMGTYGSGIYGVSRFSSVGIIYPRIWFCDRFGDRILTTPGNQSGIYVWDGSTASSPTLLSGAPTDVNYMFVSDNTVVTFGHQNIPNQIFASDQGDATNWTASSLNQVYQDVIEGADRLLTSVPVLGINLIFTQSQTYRFSKVDINAGVWEIKLLDNSVGIISPMARVSVNNVAYWMEGSNFYMWSGGNVEQIPSNIGDQCSILKYVFGDINNNQTYKCFAQYNSMFNEIWFHYPSANSNECDRIARVSLSDWSWCPDTWDRVCAEYPSNIFIYPRMISSSGVFYNHEQGNDNDGASMPFYLESNLRSSGKDTAILSGFVPDSIQTGDIDVTLTSYQWPQSNTPTYNKTFTVADDGVRENIQIGGRFWKYTWQGRELGQNWVMGQWNELVQKGSSN
jgi:hypothetical protein